jgi:cysteine-rich repeat protein
MTVRHLCFLWLLALLGCIQSFEVNLTLESFPRLVVLGVTGYRLRGEAADQPILEASFPANSNDPLLPLKLSVPGRRAGVTYQFSLTAIDVFQNPLAFSMSRATVTPGATLSFFLVPIHELDCGDGLDEDQNGLFDCEDPECVRAGSCLCRNGRLDPGEECDDGNTQSDDGCTIFCQRQNCGDGLVSLGEECDDGNTNADDGCVACLLSRCGDGLQNQGAEPCDDGNNLDGDGCSAFCLVESSALSCTPIPAAPYQAIVADHQLFLWENNEQNLTGVLSPLSLPGTPLGQYEALTKQPLALPTGGILLWGQRRRADAVLVNTLLLVDSQSGAVAWVADSLDTTAATTAALTSSGELILGTNGSGGLRRLQRGPGPPIILPLDDGFLSNEQLAAPLAPLLGLGDLLLVASGGSLAMLSGPPPLFATEALTFLSGATLAGLTFDSRDTLYALLELPLLSRAYLLAINFQPSGVAQQHFLLEHLGPGLASLSYDRHQDRLALLELGSSCVRFFPLGGQGLLDSDGDGLTDEQEESSLIFPGLLQDDADSDGDGLSDGFEFSASVWLGLSLSPIDADSDQDGLNDAQELPTPP